MSYSCINTISSCGNYSISRTCLPNIFQGDNGNIILTLLDKNGEPIDLNEITEIDILLYGLDKDYNLNYVWPDETGSEVITIIQEGEETSIINKGKLEFFIPSTFTEHLVSGDLYVAVRIRIKDTSMPGGESIITFNCINVANINYTELNFQ